MDQPLDEHGSRLLKIMRRGANSKVFETEDAGGTDGPPRHVDEVLQDVETALNTLPKDEIGDEAEFRKAFGLLFQHAETTLKKALAPDGPGLLDLDELGSLEALVIADGSRPSFLLRDGQIPPNHPFLGMWKPDFEGRGSIVSRLAERVGRIQPPDGGPANYSGTGTLVDAARGLVLTNYHVVNHARNRLGVAMEGSGPILRVTGDWVIDFAGETGSSTRKRWRINEVRLPNGVGESFDGIDAAVLRIEPFEAGETSLPAPLIMLSDDADYASGAAVQSLITIGFPGYPDTTAPAGAKVDWNWVIGTLFNNRFGLKRVAPGTIRRAAGVAVPRAAHVLAHDATTFGGASGSLVFAWKDEAQPAFALHFAGATLTDNYAAALHSVHAALRELGLKFNVPA